MSLQNPDVEADPGREERPQREREARRRYRETHADHMREYKRAWRERNAAHIWEYRAAYDAEHPDVKRAEARRYAEKKRQERRRKQSRQVSSKKYYEANKAKHHEYTRQWRLRKLAEDPEGYRAARAVIQRRWYEKHRDERNAKLRAEHRENPELKRAAARAYYAAHAEEQKAKRRAYYAANREKVLAANRAWKDRETRRLHAGLPPRRLHTTPVAERRANTAAADAFFAQQWPAEEVAALRRRRGLSLEAVEPVPAEVVARFERDSQRARIEHTLATDFSYADRARTAEARRYLAAQQPRGWQIRAAAEEARMDAIGKQINNRLRHREPPRRPHHLDPAAPHPMLSPNNPMGMNR
ncbi:hypothetical protein [Microbacterium sp. Leaf288]|uniref:hypothetical protein n=1 Tax=Microbacterium sp. Leaf288 TaxID=1736323 RepID=UPI0006F6BB71|nr:hypothetical protein [Microbacterium sp. Leaf288]